MTKDLADQWETPGRIPDLLQAFEMLAASFTKPANKNREIVAALAREDKEREMAYRAALGDIDRHGTPTISAPISLVDSLAKATSFVVPADPDANEELDIVLFQCAKKLVVNLYNAEGGFKFLALDNAFQSGGAGYAGMAALMQGYWMGVQCDSSKGKQIPPSLTDADAEKHMALLRLAFQENSTKLVAIIHAVVAP